MKQRWIVGGFFIDDEVDIAVRVIAMSGLVKLLSIQISKAVLAIRLY